VPSQAKNLHIQNSEGKKSKKEKKKENQNKSCKKKSANKQTELIEAAAPPASDVDRLCSSEELKS